MIIDELIAVIFSFLGLFLEGFSAFFVLIINGFAYLIEFIMLLFISDFSLGRVKGYKRKDKNFAKNNHKIVENKGVERYFSILIILTVIAYIAFDHYKTREITFIAEDGHSLPFASIVIYQDNKELHKRTNNDGSLEISRFGIDKIVINDKRYKSTTWDSNEITSVLTVKRSLFGKGVDKLASKLLEKFNGD